MNIIIATIKTWNIENAIALRNANKGIHNIYIITDKDDLTLDNIKSIAPDFIFFPHWSYIIPQEIFTQYKCVVFHMTDLPYGRGGSPLQNLIVNGHSCTKISALEVTKDIDAGPIYLKMDLELSGSARDIFIRASNIIFNDMIPCFLRESLIPSPQTGTPVLFKRRTITDGEIKSDFSISKVYDYVRMLDAEGYPPAFINYGHLRLEFSSALITDGILEAKVTIKEVHDYE